MLLLLLGVLYLLRVPLFGGPLARMAGSRLSEALGGVFAIERIEGSWFGDLVIIGLRTETAPVRGPVRHLSFDRASASYNLFDLLSNPANVLRSFEVRGLAVELDLAEPADPEPSEPFRLSDIEPWLPDALPALSIPDARIAVRTPGGTFEAGSLSIDGTSSGIRLRLQGLRAPPEFGVPVPDSWSLRIDRTERAGVAISSPDAFAGLLVDRIEARQVAGDVWSAEARLALFGASLDATATPERFALALHDFSLASIPSWVRDFAKDAPWPAAGVLGASIRGPVPGSSIEIDADLSLRDLAVHRVESARLEGSISYRDGAVFIHRLEARAPLASLSMAETAIDPSSPFLIGSTKGLEASLEDARAAAESWGLDVSALPWPAGAVGVQALLGGETGGIIEVRSLKIAAGGASAALAGTVRIPADPDAVLDTAMDLRFQADVPDLAAALPPGAGLGPAAGSVRAGGLAGGTIREPVFDFSATAANLEIRGIQTSETALAGSFAGGSATVSELRARGPWGSLQGSGHADIDRRSIDAVQLEFATADPGSLEQLLGGPGGLGGSAEISISGSKEAGPWNAGYSASLRVRVQDLERDGIAFGEAAVDADIAWPVAEIRRVSVEGPLGRFSGRGAVQLEDLALPGIDLREISGEFPDLARIRSLIPSTPGLGGSLAFEGRASKEPAAPFETLASSLRIQGRDLAIPGAPPLDTLDLRVRSEARRIRIEELRAGSETGSLSTVAEIELHDQGGRALVTKLQAAYDGFAFDIREPLAAEWTDAGRIRIPRFAVETLGGHATGSLSLDETLDIELHGTGIDLGRLPFDTGIAGIVRFELSASGDPQRPDAVLRVAAPDLLLHGERARLEAEILQGPDGIRVPRIHLASETSTEVHLEGAVPATAGVAGIASGDLDRATLRFDLKTSDLDLLRRCGLPPDAGLSRIAARIEAAGGTLKFAAEIADPTVAALDRAWALTPLLAIEGDADRNRTRVRFRLAEGAVLTGSGSASAAAGFRLSDAAASVDAMAAATLDAAATVAFRDLAALRPLIPGLRALSGSATAEFAASGTVSRPEPRGVLRLQDLNVRMEGDLPTMTDGRLLARVDGSVIHIDPFEGQLGYGPFSLAGSMTLPRGEAPLSVDLKLAGDNLLLARTQHLRVRSDLDLAIQGALEALRLSGTIRITDALYSQPIDLTAGSAPTAADSSYQLFSLRDPPLSTLQFDLRVLADRTIRVSNNIARGAISSDLRLRGTGSVPHPEGRLFFTDTRVQLPFSNLNIERGDVVFEPNSPFAPRIGIHAKTRMRGYDLEVRVGGRLPDTLIQVSSEPHLSQQDALALLTLGATPASLQEEGLSRAALTRIGSLMADGLLSEIAGPTDPDSEGIGDRISLEVGRDVSRTGSSTIEFEYQILEQLFLRAERDKYDAYNMGAIWRWRFR